MPARLKAQMQLWRPYYWRESKDGTARSQPLIFICCHRDRARGKRRIGRSLRFLDVVLLFFHALSYHRLVQKKHGSTGKRQEATFRSNRKNETQGKKSSVSMLMAFEPKSGTYSTFVTPYCTLVEPKLQTMESKASLYGSSH